MRSLHFHQLVAGIIPLNDLLHVFAVGRDFFHEIKFLFAHHPRIVVHGVPRLDKVFGAIPAPFVFGLVIVNKFLGDVLHHRPQPFFPVRLQSLGVGSSVSPYFFQGISIQPTLNDDVVMESSSLGCFKDRYPLGIFKPHLFLAIIHPVHEAGKHLLGFFFVLRQGFIVIGQTEQIVILTEIAMHQGFKVANRPLAVGLPLLGDGCLVFPLPVPPEDSLPRGHVVAHLGKERPHPVPSTMAKSFSYSFFSLRHCLSPSFLHTKSMGICFSVISYNSKQDRPPPVGGRKKTWPYCVLKAGMI